MNNDMDEVDIGEIVQYPAMYISVVIRHILKYLNLADIKNSRLISYEWNLEAQYILKTRSVIKFDGPLFHPSKFFDQFAVSLESNPFTSFRIDCNFLPWAFGDFHEFFKCQKKNLRELEIKNILFLKDEAGRMVDSFEITPWIANSAMHKADTKYHTKLIIGEYSYPSVQNDVIANINELSLTSVKVNLQDKILLHPIQLKLREVIFCKDAKVLSRININDIVDLSVVKHMTLESSAEHDKTTEICVDFSGKADLVFLSMDKGIAIKNWRTCTWTVTKLIMCKTFLERTSMQIQELFFSYFDIDLSVLPKSLRKLKIFRPENIICSNSHTILDNLHHLKLSGLVNVGVEFVDYSTILIKCTNLVDLSLDVYPPLELSSDLIPKTLKRLKLYKVTINWMEGTGSRDFNLDQLALIHYSFKDAKTICSMLMQTKEVVLRCVTPTRADENFLNFLQYLQLRNRSDYKQRIYVGPLNWEHASLKESKLTEYVDRKAKYYVFENQIGKALDINWRGFRKFEMPIK